jgi:hypothetical protein
MFETVNILLIRGAPGIDTSMVGELLRASSPNGAVIDISSIRNMINIGSQVSAEGREYHDAIAASCAPVTVLLENYYSPIVVVGAFSLDAMNSFIAASGTNKVISVSLYASDDVLVYELCKETNREKHVGIHSSDILVRRKKKRRTECTNLEFARSMNRHIYETRHKTDVSIYTSCLDPGSIVTELLKVVSDFCCNAEITKECTVDWI